MISSINEPSNSRPSDVDFTVANYCELLRLAIESYSFASYGSIPWGDRFVLWRHDVDFSLNRSLALARVEREQGVTATYFVNPHSDFYNLAESDQFGIVCEVLSLGHELGLHFDSAFHSVQSEDELNRRVANEAALLEQLFGVKPVAFSFHNPLAADLSCEADSYGGLLNCYSRRFKAELPYCSDSNGYWRFRRLHDVLSAATDRCLQVLTHPGWWQESPMPARQRIFRSVYGRARSTMQRYDALVRDNGRVNQSGSAGSLHVLAKSQPQALQLCDFLWNEGHFSTLFVELWCLQQAQVNRLCKAVLRKEWLVPTSELNDFFGKEGLGIDGVRLFQGLLGDRWQAVTGLDAGAFSEWNGVGKQLIHGRGTFDGVRLEQGCIFVCDVIRRLSGWGLAQPIGYDGLAPLASIGLPTVKSSDGSLSERLLEGAGEVPAFPRQRWQELKASLGVTAPTTPGTV